MTQETVKQTLENLKEIRKDAQRSIDRIDDDEGLQRPSPHASAKERKEYEDRVKEYQDAQALIAQAEATYDSQTNYYLMQNYLKGDSDNNETLYRNSEARARAHSRSQRVR